MKKVAPCNKNKFKGKMDNKVYHDKEKEETKNLSNK